MKDEKYTLHLTEEELDLILETFNELTSKHLRTWHDMIMKDGKTKESTKLWRLTDNCADIRDKAKLLKGQSE